MVDRNASIITKNLQTALILGNEVLKEVEPHASADSIVSFGRFTSLKGPFEGIGGRELLALKEGADAGGNAHAEVNDGEMQHFGSGVVLTAAKHTDR